MIEVRLAPGVRGIGAAWVRKIVSGTLKSEKARKRWASVLVTNDRQIRELNRRYLRHDYATDVISFWNEAPDPTENGYLGDLVVSAQRARLVARELGIPFREELARYLVHGTLHLLGYTDGTQRAKLKMHGRQEAILKKWKNPRRKTKS